ncbi:MAG: alpha/beta hydrolase [Nitrospirales bacterium]
MLDNVFVFQPSEWSEQHWAQSSGLPLEEVWISVASGVRIFGWYVDAGPHQPVLLWCHGNAGNISHRLPNLSELHHRGISVFLFDYRGYGQSSGTPSEIGLYQDALAAYEFLVTQKAVDPRRLVIFGRSLGTSVAGEVVRQRLAAGLILEGAFPSIQSMADHHYLGLPARWFVDSTFNLREKIFSVSVPLLIIHGENDTIVPMKFGKQVFDTAREPKTWYPVRGAGHNDVPFVGGPAYFRQLLAFIQRVVS